MSKKSDLLVMGEMASQNLDISCATTVVQFRTVKAGGHVTMGVNAQTIHNLAQDTHVAILYMVNREQFMALQGVDQAPPEPQEQPRRSLTSLTGDEARTVFTLAFSYEPDELYFGASTPIPDRPKLGIVWIKNLEIQLIIEVDGYMLASDGDDLRGFNARKVLTYLALLGIAWEES